MTLYQRLKNFPRPLEEADVEGALCLPRRLWLHYRVHGVVPDDMIDELE